MKGYGVQFWLGQAVGEEGAAFLAKKHEQGSINLVGARGADVMVECR
jgi:hypothetical protein